MKEGEPVYSEIFGKGFHGSFSDHPSSIIDWLVLSMYSMIMIYYMRFRS